MTSILPDKVHCFPVLLLFLYLSAHVGSHWIEKLYKKSPALLSSPHHVSQLCRHRVLLLTLALGTATLRSLLHPSIYMPFPIVIIPVFFLLLITFTDAEQQVIFDHMLIPFALLAPLGWFFLALPFTEYLLAAFAGGISFLLLAILTRGGIGGGDIKLIFVLGLWFGPERLLVVLLYGLLLGGAAALLLLAMHRKKAHDYFAYGPYFTMSAFFSLLL